MLDIFWIENTAGGSFPTSIEVINEYKRQGIGAILTLTENPLPQKFYIDLNYLHLPIYNFHTPSMQELICGVNFITSNLKNNIYTFTHCLAGRAPQQTEEYIKDYINPILKKYKRFFKKDEAIVKY